MKIGGEGSATCRGCAAFSIRPMPKPRNLGRLRYIFRGFAMKTLWQDASYGLRMLLKKPGFTLTAVITLGLGIGATSTIFSFVNGILLRPLPYQDSGRLVSLDEIAAKRGNASMGVSPPNFLDWREQNRAFM